MRSEADNTQGLGQSGLSNDGELRLLRKVAAGDRQAFQSLYVSYHRRLARFLTRLTRQYDVAEEIINDTLWVVWCKAPEFRGESQVSTWIMGIAYRRALKTLGRLRTTARQTALAAADAEVATGSGADTTELQEWIRHALDQLPMEQRMVLELTYFLGHSCEEIAEIMDCPVNTVKTRMFHARRKLRTLLPQSDGACDGERA
jgi:RNA polymerase sigma-70 factor (ECF subfamily)